MQSRIEKIEHDKAVRQLEYMIASQGGRIKPLTELMNNLLSYGLDTVTDGFWILNTVTLEERYSPKFIKSLGYEGDHDFPPTMESWQKAITKESNDRAIADFVKHMETKGETPYHLQVTYNKKNGGQVDLICSGTVVDWDQEPIMLGTHKILR